MGAPVKANFIHTRQIECIAPVHLPGIVSLVSNNGLDYSSSTLNTRMNMIQIHLIAFTWPVEGGTTVKIIGTRFVLSSLLKCKFGEVEVSASYIIQKQSHVFRAKHGATTLQVTNNGLNYQAQTIYLNM